MATYNLYDAKNKFSELVERMERGEEVVIARRNVPVGKLVPIAEKPKRQFGMHKHLGRLTDEFFDPLPPEELEGLG